MEGGQRGLVVVAAAFLIQVITFGATASIGVYNIELLDYFDNDTVGVSLIGSINLGIFLGSGPIVSFLMTKFSYRSISLFGSFLLLLGLLGMPLLPYIPSLCFSFGVLGGFGSCCTYIPSHVLSGLYYDKYRSLATGVATSGSGFGGAVMPVVMGFFIDYYTWKGSLIFLAGISLHLFVFCSLLVMPPHLTVSSNIEAPALQGRSEYGHYGEKPIQTNSANGIDSTDADHDFLGLDTTTVDFIDKISCSPNVHSTESLPQEIVKDHVSDPDGNGTALLLHNNDSNANHAMPNVINRVNFSLTSSITSLHAVGSRGSSHLVITCNDEAHRDLKPASKPSIGEGKSKVPKSARHIYIFTNYGFNVYFCSNIMWNAGSAIVIVFAPEFLREQGHTPMTAAWISGAIGFGCFVGGIFGGIFGNMKFVNRQVLYTLACAVMGIAFIVFPIFNHIAWFVVLSIIGGLSFGIILGLLVVVLTDLIGVESLGNGLGYLMLSNGMGAFLGPPLAGALKGSTGSFQAGVILAGVLCVLGGVFMVFMPCRRLWLQHTKH